MFDDEITIDIETLREDLLDYYGTAMFNGFPQAQINYSEIKNASERKLIEQARLVGLNLNKYIIPNKEILKLDL